jgi:hypothetical protein
MWPSGGIGTGNISEGSSSKRPAARIEQGTEIFRKEGQRGGFKQAVFAPQMDGARGNGLRGALSTTRGRTPLGRFLGGGLQIPFATLPRGERGGQSGKQNLRGLGAGAAEGEPRPR